MAYRVDWISLTLPLDSIVSTDFSTGRPAIREGVRDLYPHITDFLTTFNDLKERGGNRIFDRGFHSPGGGFTIFQRVGKPFSLIEFTGQGTDVLRERDMLKRVIKLYHERFTRLDFAVDYETDVTPRTFALCRDEGRFKHYNDIHSETGDTYYVGSQNSERFCRVYRYNEPHPRHKLLRVEFVMKSEYAKNFGYLLTQQKTAHLMSALMNTFGFQHELATSTAGMQKIRSMPRTSKLGGTERWLFTQVLPACKKLIEAGQGDIVDIFGKKLYALYIADEIRKDNENGETYLLDIADLPTP